MVHLKPPLCSEGVCDMTMCPGVAPLLPPELISSLCSEHLMLTLPHSLSLSLCKCFQAQIGVVGGGIVMPPFKGLPICFMQHVP